MQEPRFSGKFEPRLSGKVNSFKLHPDSAARNVHVKTWPTPLSQRIQSDVIYTGSIDSSFTASGESCPSVSSGNLTLPGEQNPDEVLQVCESETSSKMAKLDLRCTSIFFIQVPIKMNLKNVGLTVKKRKCWKISQMKVILQQVSCNVSGGEIMAIMGPSGAGKTSLLNCATLNNPKGSVMTGEVTLNGETLTTEVFQKHCYIVYQKDFLAPKLTCRETLMYAALNCIDDETRLAYHVDELIENLGLEKCQHTAVGDDFTQGLSGGQKRRLSVCLGLVKMPKFLFLDEPTSGLDAVSAYKTCNHLRKITMKYNIAAVLTIHQPNTKIYDTFNKLLLLKAGMVAYFGRSNQAERWFAEKGHKLPKRTNIADHLLDVVEGKDFANKYESEVLMRRTIPSSDNLLTTNISVPSMTWDKVEKLECRPRPSLCKEMKWTIHREALLIFRDPMLYTGRCGTFALMSLFFALVYLESKQRQQDQVLSRLWLILWLTGVPSCMACVLVFSHNEATINMTRNVRNGIMRPVSYLVARLLQIPMMFLFSICSVTLGGYAMCNWSGIGYTQMVLIHAVTMLTFEIQAELLAILFPNFAVGMLSFMGIWFAEFLFAGLLVKDEDVMWPLRIICYFLPMRYGLKAMVYTEFIDTEFSGAESCDPTSLNCTLRGFTCGEDYIYPCYGETGYQVLESLHYTFSLLSGDDTVVDSILIMLAYSFVLKLLYIVKIYFMVNN